MLVIGLTGGIGSGKSAVSDLFAKKGIPIIDADQIARDLTHVDQPAYQDIITHFGNAILLTNKELNRPALRDIIFRDKHERAWLEQCLHPLILQQMHNTIALLSAPYCIAAIPLLIEMRAYAFIDRILVIDTPRETQIERVMQRDHIDRPRVEAMLDTQLPREARLQVAHDVISNSSSVDKLSMEVDRLHQIYSRLAADTLK